MKMLWKENENFNKKSQAELEEWNRLLQGEELQVFVVKKLWDKLRLSQLKEQNNIHFFSHLDEGEIPQNCSVK